MSDLRYYGTLPLIVACLTIFFVGVAISSWPLIVSAIIVLLLINL